MPKPAEPGSKELVLNFYKFSIATKKGGSIEPLEPPLDPPLELFLVIHMDGKCKITAIEKESKNGLVFYWFQAPLIFVE